MPVDINTLNNLHAQGLRASRALRQAQAERALQLLGSRDARQRAWAAQVLRSGPVLQALRQLQQLVYQFGQTIAQMRREQGTQPAAPAAPQAAEDLVGLAHELDERGLHAAADLADHVAGAIAKEARCTGGSCAERLAALAGSLDEEGRHGLADAVDAVLRVAYLGGGRPKKEKEPAAPVKPGRLTPLSTRHCPDHRGVQVARVAENVYQCPVDGRTYNHETGYVDYEGRLVPGGSVAAQTPDATPVGIPHRIFDTRENILNALN